MNENVLAFISPTITTATLLTCFVVIRFLRLIPKNATAEHSAAIKHFHYYFGGYGLATICFGLVSFTSGLIQLSLVVANGFLALYAHFCLWYAIKNLKGQPSNILNSFSPVIVALIIIIGILVLPAPSYARNSIIWTITSIIFFSSAYSIFHDKQFKDSVGHKLLTSSLVICGVLCFTLLMTIMISQGFSSYRLISGLTGIMLLCVLFVGISGLCLCVLADRQQALALMDSMTGLYNRRHFDLQLEALKSDYDRSGAPYCLVMCDLDWFKKVNDQFGHQAGDEVIKDFAVTLRKEFRQADIVARIGGEEFAVLLPKTSLKDASVVMERVFNSVSRSLVTVGGKPIRYTASFGVSVFKSNNRLLYMEADEALYNAKKSGRNRFVVWVDKSSSEI